MTKKQKLELTWIGKENRPRLEPRIRIRLAEHPEPEDSEARCHEATLDVCGNPRCGCSSIRLQFQNSSENPSLALSGPPGDFWLELDKKSLVLTPEQKSDPECLHLDKIISAELTDADRQRLREWYLAEKLEVIQTTPVSKIDITGLPNADEGQMIGFVDVFPCGLALYFELRNETWAVDEQYCVQPGCKCKETILSFLKLLDASGKKTSVIGDTPAIRYNYRTHEARPVARGPAGSPSPDALLAALMPAQANVDAQLERRHLIMQALYARHYVEQTKSRMESLSTVPLRKVGRNEPCPCGSGRKYKHCCLIKGAV